jgi:hypothetical protein
MATADEDPNTVVLTTPRPGLYLCSRTSAAYDAKPCDEAFRIYLANTDTRNTDDPKKIPANRGTDGDWYMRGTNHRVENGKIRRDLGIKTAWAVEVPDLVAFADKHGDLVLQRNLDGFGVIEIYDD